LDAIRCVGHDDDVSREFSSALAPTTGVDGVADGSRHGFAVDRRASRLVVDQNGYWRTDWTAIQV
jgi:hypothetical protein